MKIIATNDKIVSIHDEEIIISAEEFSAAVVDLLMEILLLLDSTKEPVVALVSFTIVAVGVVVLLNALSSFGVFTLAHDLFFSLGSHHSDFGNLRILPHCVIRSLSGTSLQQLKHSTQSLRCGSKKCFAGQDPHMRLSVKLHWCSTVFLPHSWQERHVDESVVFEKLLPCSQGLHCKNVPSRTWLPHCSGTPSPLGHVGQSWHLTISSWFRGCNTVYCDGPDFTGREEESFAALASTNAWKNYYKLSCNIIHQNNVFQLPLLTSLLQKYKIHISIYFPSLSITRMMMGLPAYPTWIMDFRSKWFQPNWISQRLVSNTRHGLTADQYPATDLHVIE